MQYCMWDTWFVRNPLLVFIGLVSFTLYFLLLHLQKRKLTENKTHCAAKFGGQKIHFSLCWLGETSLFMSEDWCPLVFLHSSYTMLSLSAGDFIEGTLRVMVGVGGSILHPLKGGGFRSWPGKQMRLQHPAPSPETRRRPWWPPLSLLHAAAPSCTETTEGLNEWLITTRCGLKLLKTC